jgi:SNF2 family DNA or RNA helicase
MAVNAAVIVGKVLQVCSGAVKDSTGVPSRVDCASRLTALTEIIEGTQNKVVVFASYHASVDLLVEKLNEKWGVAWVDGRVTGGARDRALGKFADDSDCKILVAHPKTTSHGLEFSIADTTIWWSPYHSTEVVAQANERMASAAQRNPMGIYYLSCHAIEDAAYEAVRHGLSLQSKTLELFKNFVEE